MTVGVTQRAGPASAPPVEILSQLIQSYTQESPDNPLAAFLPELVRLANEGSTDTSDLDGFENAWRLAAGDPVFRDLQDDLVDQLYYEPAVALAGKTGVRTPLGIVIMYDSAIQHGLGTNTDGLPAIIAKTAGIAGGTPATGPHEVEWLRTFLSVRSEVLQENPANIETAEVWQASVGRVDALRDLLDEGGADLSGPVTIKPFGTAHTLK